MNAHVLGVLSGYFVNNTNIYLWTIVKSYYYIHKMNKKKKNYKSIMHALIDIVFFSYTYMHYTSLVPLPPHWQHNIIFTGAWATVAAANEDNDRRTDTYSIIIIIINTVNPVQSRHFGVGLKHMSSTRLPTFLPTRCIYDYMRVCILI